MKLNTLHFLALALCLALHSMTTAEAKSDTVFAAEIKDAIADEALVGISWSTVSGDHVDTGSAGYANLEQLELLSPAQRMHVGSVTKTVLAMGVLRLISEGTLSLDTNVESLLPELAFANPWQHKSPIRVQNLLDHTAGLDNIRMWQLLTTNPDPDTPLHEAFPSDNQRLLYVRTEPGTQYSYSNMGYALLGMVIEAVTEQRYERYLDNNLLAPLGMTASTFGFVSQQDSGADFSLATGYFENHVAQIAVAGYLRPAAQFTTTAPDMAKFIQFILGGGKLNGDDFIDNSLMAMLATPGDTDAQNAGLSIGHGLAFAVRDRHGVVGMCHPGTTFGFRAYICIYPEDKKGFFYAINTDNEASDYERFNALFIQHLGVSAQVGAEPAGPFVDESERRGIYFPSPNNMAEFEFVDKLFNFIWLEPSSEHLVIKSLQHEDRRLDSIDETLFQDVNRSQASHVFYTNRAGESLMSDGLNTFKKGHVLTIVFYWLSLVLGLAGLAYLFLAGFIRLMMRDRAGSKRVGLVFVNIALLGVPIYLLSNQSLLQFGELTSGAVALATLSGLLPLSLIFSLWICINQGLRSKLGKLDAAALLMSLQLCVVLLFWGQIPVIFWR